MNGEIWAGRRRSRRTILKAGAIAALGISAAAGAGCSTPSPAPTVAPSPAGPGAARPASSAAATATAVLRPKMGGTLHALGFAFANNFDPHQVTGSFHTYGPGMAYSRLLKYPTGPDVKQPTFTPVGDLAESWEQPDDVTYIFKIRPGVKWHNIPPVNGRALTAADLVYSLERQRELKVNAGPLTNVARVEAPDPQTLKVTLARPDADSLVNLAAQENKVVAREAVEAKGDLKDGPTIGTGAWLFVRGDPASGTALARNPDYFLRGMPYVDGIELTVIADLNTRISALRSGNLDVLGLASDPATHDQLRKAAPALRVLTTPNPNQAELGLRTDRGPTADLRVRKAIARAINRQEISDTVFGGRTARHPGFVLPSPDWILPEDEYKRLAAYDPEGARRLLQEAGLADGFDLKVPVTNLSGGSYLTAAELLASQLAKVNVRMVIQPTDNPAYVSGIINGTFDAFFGPTPTSNTSTNTELLTRHHSAGNRNGTGLRDPKLDALIEQQAVMGRDPEGRKKVLLDIQRYLLTDQPHLITLFVTVNEWFYQPFLRDFYPGINGITHDHFVRTWIDK